MGERMARFVPYSVIILDFRTMILSTDSITAGIAFRVWNREILSAQDVDVTHWPTLVGHARDLLA